MQTDDQVRIEVRDTGIGIDPAQQERIFEEFYQVKDPCRDSGEGLGLGLAIVARVARLLKLQIGVRSASGNGSTFFVEVPAGDPAMVMQAQHAHRDPASVIDRPVRILVIDDDPGIRESTQATLESWGHPVITAASLDDALARLADSAPDGIIVDYRLGVGQTGIDALCELEKRFGPRPSVVITGDVAGAPMRELMVSGRQWLHKPVAPAKLRAFMQSVRRAASARQN